jgi:hypothetical protein
MGCGSEGCFTIAGCAGHPENCQENYHTSDRVFTSDDASSLTIAFCRSGRIIDVDTGEIADASTSTNSRVGARGATEDVSCVSTYHSGWSATPSWSPHHCTCDKGLNGCPGLVGTFTCAASFYGSYKQTISRDPISGMYRLRGDTVHLRPVDPNDASDVDMRFYDHFGLAPLYDSVTVS